MYCFKHLVLDGRHQARLARSIADTLTTMTDGAPPFNGTLQLLCLL